MSKLLGLQDRLRALLARGKVEGEMEEEAAAEEEGAEEKEGEKTDEGEET